MSRPTSFATIKFPAKFFDADIYKGLANYYGESENGEPDIKAGIFTLEDGGARDGEFEDLENLLIEKGIPFDRNSYMDWQCPPRRRIFRPANHNRMTPAKDLEIPLDADGEEPVVSIPKIREIIKNEGTEGTEGKNLGLNSYQKLIALVAYLDEIVPIYPPLADYVKVSA